MRLKSMAVATVVATLPGLAVAQDMCGQMRELGQHARNGFQAIDGGPSRPGSNSHKTSLALPGSSECYISHSRSVDYWCTWTLPPAAVAQRTMIFGGQIGACFGVQPEWERDGNSISTFIETDGIDYYILGEVGSDGGEISLSVAVDD